MTIGEYFGTLLQSVTESHKQHLMTGKYSDHKALNEFYDEMPELVDALIEHWQGTHGKVKDYKNMIEAAGKDPVAYLEELLKLARDGQKELFPEDKTLGADVDGICGQIESTLYQLKELKESNTLLPFAQYVMESLVQESKNPENIEKILDDKRSVDHLVRYLDIPEEVAKEALQFTKETIPICMENDGSNWFKALQDWLVNDFADTFEAYIVDVVPGTEYLDGSSLGRSIEKLIS